MVRLGLNGRLEMRYSTHIALGPFHSAVLRVKSRDSQFFL